MEESPFPHHGPLPPDVVTGRDEEAHDLALRVRGHRPVAILGPRRYGKTSLVRHALWRLDDVEAIAVIWIDLYGLTSFADFAVRLDRALTSARGRLREVLDRVAGAVSIRLGVLGVELRRAALSGPDPLAATHGLLDVVTRSAESHPVVFVLDEFSDVSRVDPLAAVLRTHLQHHYRNLGLVFAGSKPSMMRTLFAERGQPFFDQADVVELGPLSQEAVAAVVHDGFNGTNRRAGPVAANVVTLAEGHPQRSMLLADAAWWRTGEGAEATDDTWADALESVRSSVAGSLTALFEELPAAQGTVLRAVAHTGKAFTRSESRFHDLSNSSATAARDALLRDGHLTWRADNNVQIVDPLLADWLRRIFP